MSLESIRYKRGNLEILDQLLLPLQTRYVKVQGVEDGWKVINKMQVSYFVSFQLIIYDYISFFKGEFCKDSFYLTIPWLYIFFRSEGPLR